MPTMKPLRSDETPPAQPESDRFLSPSGIKKTLRQSATPASMFAQQSISAGSGIVNANSAVRNNRNLAVDQGIALGLVFGLIPVGIFKWWRS